MPTSVSTTPESTTSVPVGIFAISVAVVILNLFAPQILVGPMAESLHVQASSAGLLAMLPLIGYALGLFLLVPLADLFENRALILRQLSVAIIAAFGVAMTPNVALMYVSLLLLGAACSVIQILMPLAAALTEPARRGQVLGDIMSGLMCGILLSRPIASLLSGIWGWKTFFLFTAIAMSVLWISLLVKLPSRLPLKTTNYAGLVVSLFHLFSSERILQHRSISAAIVAASFSLFWTIIAFPLTTAPFNFNQVGLAVFALCFGVGGAIFTPVIGRLSDRGFGKQVTIAAHISLVIGFILAYLSYAVPGLPLWLKVAGLGISALMLDAGVLGDQTVGRYMINLLNPDARGRINGIFVGIFFIGNALGSAFASVLWTAGGWLMLCIGGAITGLAAVIYGFCTDN